MKATGKSRKSKVEAKAAVSAGEVGTPDAGSRQECIAMAAYFRAERRGFAPGQEVDDWLAAEQDVAESCAAVACPEA